MKEPALSPPEPDLALQRAALLKSIQRASLAGILALALVVGLAGIAAWQARQSARQAARADAEARRAAEAGHEAQAQLWKARFNEARATRMAGGPGARVHAAALLAALARESSLSETQLVQLRTESLAQLAVLDVSPPTNWLTGEVDVSARSRWFVPRGQRKQVEVRSLPGSNVVATLHAPAEAYHAYFSPSGNVLAVTHKTRPASVLGWRLSDRTMLFSNSIAEAALFGGAVPVFSADEQWIGIREGAALVIRRLSDGAVVRRRGAVTAVGFSGDGRWLACANGSTVVVEDVITGSRRARIETGFEVVQAVWRPGAEMLGLAGRKGSVILWELPPPGRDSGGLVRTTEGHNADVIFAGFLGDGSALMTTGWDGFSIYWEATSGRKILAESRQLLGEISPDDQRVLATRGFPHRNGLAELWPRLGYRVVASSDRTVPPAVGVRVTPDGRWLALDHARFSSLVQASDGREVARLRGREPEFAPDGLALFTCDGEAVRRFSLEKLLENEGDLKPAAGEVFFRTPPGTTANSVAMSADGTSAFVCVAGKSVVEVDAPSGASRRTVPVAAHYARIAPGGEYLVTQLHNAGAHLIRLGSSNRVSQLGVHLNTGFDASGRWLAAASEEQLTLLIRTPTNRWVVRHRIDLQTGAGAPPPFAFSPDGRLLAVVFNRFDVRLYEPETARLLAALSPAFPAQIQGVAGLVFGADGRELFAAKQDGEVVAWTLPILRAELGKLGLDWESGPRAEAALPPSVSQTTPVKAWSPPAALAALAAGLVLVAGLVVFTVQRRTLEAYARAEAVAQERQRRLLEAQVALVQSQKLEALGTLAAGLAHDFNNLLSVIRMSNHFVARAVKPEGPTRENIQAIEQAVTQGRDIIRSMLGYARRADDAASELSVPRVVGDTMGMLSRQFLSGLTVSLELDPACPSVRGSRAQLEQVLLNLVVNAAEAMNGQGRLIVSASPAPPSPDLVLQPAAGRSHVQLAVRDSGPGIAPEHVVRVFEPFFTTKGGRTQPGTGLGLSVVETIARQSGWGLGVRSRPGEGTVFVVLLPVADGPG